MSASTEVLGQQTEKAFEDRLDTIKHLQEIRSERQSKSDSTNSPGPVGSEVDLGSLNDKYTLFEFDQEWSSIPNPNPELNFNLLQQGQPAGNVNGDSINGNPVGDYIVVSKARDEATPDLSDQTWKTGVFYGGNTSGTPDQVVDRQLIPVGDLNGDGYTDAVSPGDYPSMNVQYYYAGSSEGYTNIGVEAGHHVDRKIIGFFNYNDDEYEDFLTYDSYYGDVTVVQGAEQFSNMNEIPQTGVLSGNSPRVVVEDIEPDTVQEIIEFSGSEGVGVISVFKIDTSNATISQQQSFSFTSFSGAASDHELHVINADSTQYKEILITVKEDTASYFFQYDSQNSQFNNTHVKINQILRPVGDLNGDGIHDFVEGATGEEPQVFYGTKDLQNFPAQNQPTLSSKTSGAQWNWNMQYNPYSEFGDLTGDGVDDAVLKHIEQNNNTITSGRRIVEPDTTTSPTTLNSNFQLYPFENFHSVVSQTQDLGDINNDGIDDFAMVYPVLSKVELYFGGSSISDTPDKTLSFSTSSSSFLPDGIAAGDYNGDGISDMAISDMNGKKLVVFFGGSSISDNPDFSITSSNFQSDSGPGFYNVRTIGDVNEDGIDDFILSSLNVFEFDNQSPENEAYIFFGGSSISDTPDKTINLSSQENQIQSGISMVGLGDVNADGIDDFAVSSAVFTDAEGTGGVVYVYFGGANKSYGSPDLVLESADNGYAYRFGHSVAGGDFTGNGVNDIAVSSAQFSDDRAIQIFHGGSNIDNTADSLYSRPVLDQYEAYDAGSSFGHLEVIPDFNNDDKDELLLSSRDADSYSNAALYTFNNNQREPTAFFKAPNQEAGLGGANKSAVGDFTGNGQPEVVFTQIYDNNDAYQSSRIYRYALPNPIKITKVEDVPNDQGKRLRIHTGGYLMDAMENGIYGIDNWSVWRMTDSGSWTNLATISPTNNGAGYVDVTVNNTQPTGIDTVDYTYTLRLEAFNSDQGVLARSDTARGTAYDNISPPAVQSVSVNEQSSGKMLSWQASDANDVAEYEVYQLGTDGSISDSPVGSSHGTSYSLSDAFEGVQNFTVRPRDVNNNLGEYAAPGTAIYPQTTSYQTDGGWNLIGLPVDANVNAIESTLLETSNGTVYEYNGGYKQVTELQAGQGYWIKFPDAAARELVGEPFTQFSLDLRKGWNLISGVGAELAIANIEDPDEILVDGTFYAFDNGAYSDPDTLDSLRPGMGYWVKTSSAGTITLTHPKMKVNTEQSSEADKAQGKIAEKVTDNFNEIIVSDGSHSKMLYFGATLPDEVDNGRYSVPPLPPGNVFDARFSNDKRLVEKDEVRVQVSKIEGSKLHLKVVPKSMAEASKFVVKEYGDGQLLSEYEIKAEEKIRFRNSKTNSIYLASASDKPLGSNEVPEEFKLEQNYPNPFNPTTQIEYAITDQANVTLDVFNILGRKVTTLVSTEQSPGRYQVTFDGSNLASGVYLYRLRAGDRVSTKKFILAK